MNFLEEHIHYLVLYWVRSLALTGTLNIFGTSPSARFAKLGIGIMLGTILALIGNPAGFIPPESEKFMMLLVAKEFLIGALFGYVANIIFATAQMAGHLVGEEMGFNMASITDPLSGRSVQVIAQIYEMIAIAAFFATGGHLFLVRCLARSFEVHGVGDISLDMGLVESATIYGSGVFVAALEIAAPIFVSMILIGVILALLAKVAPELHPMDFAYPVKVAGGLSLIFITSKALGPAMQRLFDAHGELMEALLTKR